MEHFSVDSWENFDQLVKCQLKWQLILGLTSPGHLVKVVLEKNCCWVRFWETEQKSLSTSSVKFLSINILHFLLYSWKSHDHWGCWNVSQQQQPFLFGTYLTWGLGNQARWTTAPSCSKAGYGYPPDKITIQLISVNKTNHAIHWIVIYLVGSIIHLSNNVGLMFKYSIGDITQLDLPFLFSCSR